MYDLKASISDVSIEKFTKYPKLVDEKVYLEMLTTQVLKMWMSYKEFPTWDVMA